MSRTTRILRPILTWAGRKCFPKQYWKLEYLKMTSGGSERELTLLPALIQPGSTGVDVGAADGLYAVHLLKHGADVIAFEPRPLQANALSEMAATLGLPIRVEPIALSNRSGMAKLNMLSKDLGRSTIESANVLDDPDKSPRRQLEIETRRLDDYDLQSVGLIKIDVEGHELAVLEGANETVSRSRCSLLVEAEDRHVEGATKAVFEWMDAHGYAGFFLIDDVLLAVENFDLNLHQNPKNIGGWRTEWVRKGLYVNNFVFVPLEHLAPFFGRCHKLGFTLPENTVFGG